MNQKQKTQQCRGSIDVGADDPVCPKGIPNCARPVSARGITLIALVITIIVLLILAGVAINLVIGDNGILNNAKKAGKEYQNSANYEQKLLGDTTNAIDNIISGGNGSLGVETETPPATAEIEPTGATHSSTTIQYSWGDIAEVAKIISDNSATISNNTEEVTVKMNGKSYTLGIGDTAVVDEKTVRIIGFNHDELANRSIYGGSTNTYAGITFEYVDFLITEAQMNSTDTNEGGWEACELRGTLNSTTLESITIKNYIKEVKKEYIATGNDPESITTSQDKLWLLSCGEIWDNGYNGGDTRGWAIATEGSQYKYYKKTGTTYTSDNPSHVKASTYWWLRSPSCSGGKNFCDVSSKGYCNTSGASNVRGFAPGFAI